MTSEHPLQHDDLSVLLEGSGYLCVLLVAAFALQCHWISLGMATKICALLLLSLLFLAWRQFKGGRHPCFLFLAMLLIFQGGRLIGYTLGVLDRPFRIVVQTSIPFDVSPATAQLTLLLLALSALCVYLPCRWRFSAVKLEPLVSKEWLSAAYVLLLITFPFMLYKNYLYLNYVRSHGGYLSVFTDNEGIVNSAGFLIRSVSLAAYSLFLIIFVLERRRKYLIPITLLFIASSSMELFLGFRGKVFLLLITLWYVNNLKKGARFRLVPLAATAVLLSLLAVFIAGFRENTTAAVLSPVRFVADQGLSLGVTESAIEFSDLFHQNSSRYLLDSMETAYKAAGGFGQGELFANDLSLFLNRRAFSFGFATGSSYLAESYLAGGILLVIVASIAIGVVLRWLHAKSVHTLGAVVLILVLPSLIYLPRSELLDPLAGSIKSLMIAAFVFWLLWLIRQVRKMGFDRSRYRDADS